MTLPLQSPPLARPFPLQGKRLAITISVRQEMQFVVLFGCLLLALVVGEVAGVAVVDLHRMEARLCCLGCWQQSGWQTSRR